MFFCGRMWSVTRHQHLVLQIQHQAPRSLQQRFHRTLDQNRKRSSAVFPSFHSNHALIQNCSAFSCDRKGNMQSGWPPSGWRHVAKQWRTVRTKRRSALYYHSSACSPRLTVPSSTRHSATSHQRNSLRRDSSRRCVPNRFASTPSCLIYFWCCMKQCVQASCD